MPLEADKASLYRAFAARCNYIGDDRADAQYAIKELCRRMSAPTQQSWTRLVRLWRYLLGRPRAVIRFLWQQMAKVIDIFSDANWAGCKTARKSTSGGVAMLGRCCVKSWSKTQGSVAQSSAESELIATVRGATEGIGFISRTGSWSIAISSAPCRCKRRIGNYTTARRWTSTPLGRGHAMVTSRTTPARG